MGVCMTTWRVFFKNGSYTEVLCTLADLATRYKDSEIKSITSMGECMTKDEEIIELHKECIKLCRIGMVLCVVCFVLFNLLVWRW